MGLDLYFSYAPPHYNKETPNLAQLRKTPISICAFRWVVKFDEGMRYARDDSADWVLLGVLLEFISLLELLQVSSSDLSRKGKGSKSWGLLWPGLSLY